MQLPVGHRSRKDFWLNHIRAAEEFEGTNKEYCRVNGLNPRNFNAYRSRYGFARKKTEVKIKSAGFSTVQVVDSSREEGLDLPDPRWLAEFLKAWGV